MTRRHPMHAQLRALIPLALMSILLVSFPARAAESSAPKPAVLVIGDDGAGGGAGGIDFPTLQKLARAGLQVDYLEAWSEFTWERIRRYHALVLLDLLPLTTPHPERELPRTLDLLDRFTQQGGGVWVIPNLDWWVDYVDLMRAVQRDFFPRYGARYQFQHWLRDPRLVTAGIWPRNQYAYTGNFSAHPITAGLTGLWFPVDYSGRLVPATTPITVDTNWTVIVRAAATTYSTNAVAAGVNPVSSGYPADICAAPVFERAPALLAVRELNRGRMALLTMNKTFHLTGGTSRGLAGVMMDGQGINDVPNDLLPLFVNTLRWLAEPGLAAGTLGGYTQDEARLREPRPALRPVTARELEEFPAELPTFRGLIGARSALSTGHTAPADLIAAARQAGLDYLVFLEEFTALTPEKLARLKEVCAAGSDARFQAIPGFQINDNRGHAQFYFGPTIVWPDRVYLTADGREFDVAARPDSSVLPQIGFMLSHAEGKNALGYFNFQPHRASAPMYDLRLYNTIGLLYYQEGQLREGLPENLPEFLELNDQGVNPLPVSIDIVTTPAQLQAALTEGRFLTCVLADRVEHVMRALQYGYLVPPRVYVSQGPVIRDWSCLNRDYETVGQNFLTRHYRWPVRCHVTSDAGLAEVRIWDGPELFRHYRLHGAKEFQQVLQLTHNQQKNLVLEVTDVQGRQAISAEQFDRNQIYYRYWCSDRENGWLFHGPHVFHPATENGPAYAGKGIDSAVTSLLPSIRMHPRLRADRGTEGDRSFNNRPFQLLASEDATLARVVCAKKYPLTEPLWITYGTYGPLVDTDLFEFQHDRLDYRVGYQYWPLAELPDDPDHSWVTPSLFTTRVTFKQDLTVEELQWQNCGWPQDMYKLPGNEVLLAVNHTQEGVNLCAPYPHFAPGTGPYTLARDGFLAVFGTKATGAGVLYNLDAPVLFQRDDDGAKLLANLRGQRVRKGDTYTCRFLTLSGRAPDRNSLQRYDEIRRYLGLHAAGRPGYDLRLTRGRALSTRGLLDLEAKNGVVALAIPAPKTRPLHVILGLRIYGLNSRWSAGLHDRATNRYRPIGTRENIGYVRLNPETGESADVAVGHPLIADAHGRDLFIQVTQLSDSPAAWHIAVNNPTPRAIKTTLRQALEPPGLKFPATTITLQPGETRNLP